MPLKFLAGKSLPLDFSRIAAKVMLINITIISIIIVIITISNNNSSNSTIISLA